MAKKIPQALKFSQGLDEDLHILADMKGMAYNVYVEGILSNHVLVQKRLIKAHVDEAKKRMDDVERPIKGVGIMKQINEKDYRKDFIESEKKVMIIDSKIPRVLEGGEPINTAEEYQ